MIAARDEDEWTALCRAIGKPDLASDARFATLAARKSHEDALSAILAGWSQSQDKHEAARLLQKSGVPAAPVQTPEDLAKSDYLAHRGFFTWLDHPDAGSHPHPTLPMRLSVTPGGQRRAAPTFGGDTQFVLESILQLGPDEIRKAWEQRATTDLPLPGG